jgi:hypothetical protein
MFRTLFELGKVMAFGFLLNDYLKRNYSDQYEYTMVSISYKLIVLYSKLEFITNQATNYIIEKNPSLIYAVEIIQKHIKYFTNSISDFSSIEFIKDSKIVKKTTKDLYFNMDSGFENIDFIAYYQIMINKPINVKIIHIPLDNKNNLLKEESIFELEQSSIKFMLVELHINREVYKIDLMSEKFNFYIVNNILDKAFFLYYMRYYTDIDIDSIKIEDLFLKIIDHDIETNIYDLNKHYCIQIEKNNYNVEFKN